MTDKSIYENNPLHGVGLEQVLTELVDHYGFEILFAYLNLNCFKTKPSIASSLKFLKKTDWAKDKVEGFIYINLKVYLALTTLNFNFRLVIVLFPPIKNPQNQQS